MTVKVVSTFQPPTAIVFSVKCQLTPGDLEYLVTATINSLSVYCIQDRGLELEFTQEIAGSVIDLQTIPIPDSPTCNLLVMLDHPQPELLFFSYSESRLVLDKQLSLEQRGSRPAEFLNAVSVHSSGRAAVVSCYACKLKVITLEDGKWQSEFDVNLPQANLLSMAFLPLEEDDFEEVVLAVLHIDHQERTQLLSMRLDLEENDLNTEPSSLLQPTAISSKHIPCPADQVPLLFSVPARDNLRGGILIVGGKKILLFELASTYSQQKQERKADRITSRKKSSDQAVVEAATSKEKEREGRKKKARATIEWPWSQVTACAPIPGNQKFLIGDAFGRLALLSLETLEEHGLVLVPLDETSPPSTISYLTNNVVFLGSFAGNSQLIKILTGPSGKSSTITVPSNIRTSCSTVKGKERAGDDDMDVDQSVEREPADGTIIQPQDSMVEILDTFKNIAPINDAIVVQSRADSQSQIVTCSGGAGSGSLSVIRTGADFERLGQVPELKNIIDVWPLKAQSDDPHHSHLLVSTVGSSHLFRIESAGQLVNDEPSSESFLFSVPTLCARNVTPYSARCRAYPPSGCVVQITQQGARMLQYQAVLREFEQKAVWEVPSLREWVTAASINNGQIFLALKSKKIVCLTLHESGFKDVPALNISLNDEVSAISGVPLKQNQPTTDILAVAVWKSLDVRMYSLKSQSKLVYTSPKLPAPVTSLLLHAFTSNGKKDVHPHLLCGLTNGSVASFAWDPQKEELSDLKIVSLGSLPVRLATCKVNGKSAVFAAGSRGTLVCWDKKHLSFSPVLSRDTLAATVLNTPVFRSCLLLTKPSEIIIGQINDEDRLHIRQIPLARDRPMRIIHDASLQVFGVATTRSKPERVGMLPTTISSFRLLDDSSFTNLAQYDCSGDEEIVSLLHHKLPRGTSLYCVGTFLHVADEIEPSEGRLLIFTADRFNRNKLIELSATPVKGSVFSLASVNGLIAAACNASVMLFRVTHSDDSGPAITVQKAGEWCHNYLVTQIAAINNRLVVGDAMHSVSLLEVSPDDSLKTIARDFIPLWPIAVEAIDEHSIIGANDGLNLFSFTLQFDGNRASLQRDGFYHYGDVVSKIVRGSLATAEAGNNTPARQTHILFTSSGRISTVVNITDDKLANDLVNLQLNMGIVTSIPKAFGGVTHARFRAPRNTRGRSDADQASNGFLDGDLLHKFLTCEDEDRILNGSEQLTQPIDTSGAEIRKILEVIQDMQ